MGKVRAIPKVGGLHITLDITLDALLESDPLGTAAGLRTSLHLYP